MFDLSSTKKGILPLLCSFSLDWASLCSCSPEVKISSPSCPFPAPVSQESWGALAGSSGSRLCSRAQSCQQRRLSAVQAIPRKRTPEAGESSEPCRQGSHPLQQQFQIPLRPVPLVVSSATQQHQWICSCSWAQPAGHFSIESVP